MEDNDIVLADDTVSRYHCQIVQDDTGYVLIDNALDERHVHQQGPRPRGASSSRAARSAVGQSQLKFNAREEEVQIVPSRADRCGGLIGGNAKMREIYSIIEKIAPTATTVVIDGETGTGKEVVAQAIHSLSPRSRNELVVFDCGAVPPNLIESELFGHEKGSFTGAMMTRDGPVRAGRRRHAVPRRARRAAARSPAEAAARARAARGPPRRRGEGAEGRRPHHRGDQPQPRGRGPRGPVPPGSVLPAQRRAPAPAVAARARRRHPAARPALPRHTARTTAAPNGTPRVRGVAREAMTALQNYPWPGNVRELVNVDRARGVVLRSRARSSCRDLPDYVRTAKAGAARRARGAPRSAQRAAAVPAGASLARAAAADARGAARRGRHVQGREGALGRDVRARLHPPAAAPQQRQHLARRARTPTSIASTSAS